MSDRRPFLTARWRHLLMLNFEVDPDCLTPLVPPGTELDSFQGHHLISIVAFEFSNARLHGVRAPGPPWFPEVNLRFYVRRRVNDGWRRGVVFVKELVPRRIVALIARRVFGQKFEYSRMRYFVNATRTGDVACAQYEWTLHGCACHVAASVGLPSVDEEHRFIAEHFYAYAKRAQASIEYRVQHRPWSMRRIKDISCELHPIAIYGETIGHSLTSPPRSAFYADGSEVSVYPGERLRISKTDRSAAPADYLAPCS